MFFFFPFTIEAPQRPTGRPATQLVIAPATQSSRMAHGEVAGISSFDAASLSVELVKRALTAITSSLTALGSRSNALFAQMAAALAFDRAARDTASSFGMIWPVFRPFPASPSFSPHFSQRMANPWAAPLSAFTDALDFWAKFWVPVPDKRNSPASAVRQSTSPLTTSISMPGLTMSFTWAR